MVIANAKAAIRAREVLFAGSTRPRGLVLLAVLQVTQDFCEASVRHCGYWSQVKQWLYTLEFYWLIFLKSISSNCFCSSSSCWVNTPSLCSSPSSFSCARRTEPNWKRKKEVWKINILTCQGEHENNLVKENMRNSKKQFTYVGWALLISCLAAMGTS